MIQRTAEQRIFLISIFYFQQYAKVLIESLQRPVRKLRQSHSTHQLSPRHNQQVPRKISDKALMPISLWFKPHPK